MTREHFQEIASACPRFFGKSLIIAYRPSTHPQLGMTVRRTFGKAPKRNHFKRLVREAFRLHQHTLAPYEMVIFPQKGLKSYSLQTIAEDFLSLHPNNFKN